MYRLAKAGDLPQIIDIYNQVIDRRTVTADLEPATVENRKTWFEQHLNSQKYPLWVIEWENQILGWCSYSPFYSRPAYDGTAEISFYLDKHIQGKGMGKQTLNFLIEQMPNYQLHTLLAFVFGNNLQSLALLNKIGFKQWGHLPKIADMQEHWEDLIVFGYKK